MHINNLLNNSGPYFGFENMDKQDNRFEQNDLSDNPAELSMNSGQNDSGQDDSGQNNPEQQDNSGQDDSEQKDISASVNCSDVVVTSRVRLARNLAEYPFIGPDEGSLSRSDSEQMLELLRPHVIAAIGNEEPLFVTTDNLSDIDKDLLLERHLISKELKDSFVHSAAVISPDEHACIMINEEDHLRIQTIYGGYRLQEAFDRCRNMDMFLEKKLVYAFHDRYGYLTKCPSNVGTGLRISVMLHLPGLVLTRQIDRLRRSLDSITLTSRGINGEGTNFLGDFYQISNQTTLGSTEEEILEHISDLVPEIVRFEQLARAFLLRENGEQITARVTRAYEILCSAPTLSSEEAIPLLSNTLLGVQLKILPPIPLKKFCRAFLEVYPAHLQRITGRQMESTQRGIERMHLLKEMFQTKK